MSISSLSMKLLAGAWLVLTFIAANLYRPVTFASSAVTNSRESKMMKLVTEYTNNILEDISADSRLLLFC